MSLPNVAGIILAAGKGTRMKSELPKGLHKVCGVPMIELVGRAMKAAGVARPVVVIGHLGEVVQEKLGDSYDYVWQREQLGTGHAALMAEPALAGHRGAILIAPGDTPLITSGVFTDLLEAHFKDGAQCTIASARMDDPTGYGRVIRGVSGGVERVVEERDASSDQRLISEVNTSVYCFDGPTLFSILPALKNANSQGEYYLTDAVAAAADHGRAGAMLVDDASLLTGVNDRWQLALVDKALRMSLLRQHALSGVTFMDPETVYIGVDVTIGQDTIIEPSTMLMGATVIGSRCRIGPFTKVKSSEIGDECYVYQSYVNEGVLMSGVKLGPFAHIRPGTVLRTGVKIGNFVEVKNSDLGAGTSASHLTYIGDSTVGTGTNIGAGTITCNYDGFHKHRTTIGDNVFVGSNSTLVAPVTIEDGAMIAAGSVVTRDIPSDALGIGRSRTEVKEQWAALWRKRKQR